MEYRRRRPEETVLHRAVSAHLATLFEEARRREAPLPASIERAFLRYLGCGLLPSGFVRVRCTQCGGESLVAFSCKQRGLCPSCSARRAAEAAAWLVDRVLPRVPIRQWTVSLPFGLRLLLARAGELRRAVLDAVLEEVFAQLRAATGCPQGQGGAVTFVQRFGSSLNLNLHFHCLVLDGVYASGEQVPQFVPAPALQQGDVELVAQGIRARVEGLLRGRAEPQEPADALGQLQAASLLGTTCLGPRAGRRVRRVGGESEPFEPRPGRLCSMVEGFSVHAATLVEAQDRLALERLCRYGLRGPLALSRLTEAPGGRIALRLAHPHSDGTTHLLLEPLELVERLAALVPPAREHLIHFHGVLAAHAAWRKQVVPAPADAPAACAGRRTRRGLDWANLLKRVFALEVLVCPLCNGTRRIIAAIEPGPVARKILRHLGVPDELPPLAAARGPPQGELPLGTAEDFDQTDRLAAS